ncbi:MAG TPA: outer membrane protein assembly factor BamD [Bacteroidales bacterium]|nr:outer membrane protein assembly factor BamD [Bacteroidales bacterium]HRZ49922.1 outer membrane protein assembly factor BamD [Bacteroidales bacterium]
MYRKRVSWFVIMLISIVLTSCDGYNKLLKSKDFEKKYEAALQYYDKKDYFKAQQLFDELLVIFRGTPRAEEIFFKYAYTYYYMDNYADAAEYFQRYAATFPKSEKAEEAYFMSAFCKYKDSPKFNLDQSSTFDAISQMQSFVNVFPNSARVADCNRYMDELRKKLEKKEFERAKLYHTTGYDKSAVTALNLFVKENPGSEYREEAMYLVADASLRYALRSVASKRSERIGEAKQAAERYMATYPSGVFKSRMEALSKKIESEISQNK